MRLDELLAVARGDQPADLVIENARIVNVFDGSISTSSLAIAGGRIVGLGSRYHGKEVLDAAGSFVAPGFIDAHVHIESSMVPPSEFARAVVPRGVTTVVTDPHEIANVCGLDGIRFMLRDAETAPLEIFTNASSCVPATDLETSGATLRVPELRQLLSERRILGLAEVMNFPGVVAGDAEILSKLQLFQGRVLDGHCPGLRGKALNAYATAQISSDHECIDLDEAREKLKKGMVIFIREATNARNLHALLPLVDPWSERRICFCTDDRTPRDLLENGSIDQMVRSAIASGMEPAVAFRLATLNPADHYRLLDRGALAPGRRADFVIFRELHAPRPDLVYIAGEKVAEDGRALFGHRPTETAQLRGTVSIPSTLPSFRIAARPGRIRVIGMIENQLRTEHLVIEPKLKDGQAVADSSRDLAKIAVLERHHSTGKIGLGFVHGFGLTRGAIAGTVAHDHHNLIAVGMDDRSLSTAVRAISAEGGGLAATAGDKVLGLLPLPIAGLMSDAPIEQVAQQIAELRRAARSLGTQLDDPFMALSFLGLEVIPSLKLTDRGLVDVNRLEIVPLFRDQIAEPVKL